MELYGHWAQALGNRHAYVACVQIAREGLEIFPLGEVEQEKIASAALLNSLHDAFISLGMIAESNAVLNEALTLLEGCNSPEARLHRARTRYLHGRLLVQQGDPKGAEKELLAVAADLEDSGHKQQQAVTLVDIARLQAQAGDVAGALKLYEETIGIFEQLGDVQSRAVTLGYIAHLRAQAGDVAGALKLHEEIIGIFEQFGDDRSRAVTLGDIAQLRAQAGDVAEARRLQTERLEVIRKLGDLDEIANTLYYLAGLDLAEKKSKRLFLA